MKVRTMLALVAIAVLVLPMTATAAPPPRGNFTATIAPAQACVGEQTNFALTITCTLAANQGLGSAEVLVPAGFSIIGAPTVTSPASKPWTAVLGTGSVILKSNADANRLACGAGGESVTLNFAASAPALGTYTWTTDAYQSTDGTADDQYSISGAQPTVEVVECGQTCLQNETAWAAGPRYVEQGNWATYTPYVAETTVTLFAGQTMDAGTVYFSAAGGGYVTIIITLGSGWDFADIDETVKIQDYAAAPSGNPAPGLFASKGDATASPFSIDVPENSFYGVHVDVAHEVACP